MADSVQLGAAHVTFTADFSQLMKAIDDAVRLAKQAAGQIEGALSGINVGAKRTGTTLATELAKAATASVRSWNAAVQSIRAGLRKLTSELVFIQLDISHLANMLQRMAVVGTAAIGGMAAASMSFEDAFANVRKTVDASEAEFRQLEQSLRQMSTQTRTSASDLALIMSTAGQLGVRGADNLTKFTRTIDMLQVATNIVGQEGAQALAQFMNIMQENLGNVDRVGAAITELGNNFAATEADILNMAQRLAGAGKTVGLTTADVLGLATALSAVGIRAEMGGSALSRVLINMSQAVETNDERLREFARTAGMSAREFADTFRRDPVRALQAFIEGLRRLDSEGKNVFATLENVGASEIRVRDTLLRLFQASDLLADAVERSNRAWEENIALTEEFERFMGTGVARLRVMWNTIVEVARIVGDVYNPVIKQAADFTQGVADALRRMTPEQQRAIAELGALATGVLGGVAAFLLAIKTITTFATGLVLLTRAVVFFLSPWTLLTMAVIAAAIAIASKWDEIREIIAQTDLGKAAIEAWESFKKVWQSDELTLPEKIVESVKIVVKFVTGLIESIINWWLAAAIELSERGARILGLNPDTAWLPSLLRQLRDIWSDEDLSFPEKVLESVVITVGEVAGLIDSIVSWWLGVSIELARKTVEMLGLDPDNNALVKFLERIKDWWDNEKVELGPKVVEIMRLGVKRIAGIVDDIKALWADDDLTLPEKVIGSVHIVTREVLGLAESIADWFLNAAIDLTRDVAVTLGIDWQNSRLGQLVDQIQEWWNDEDITLTEKVLGVVTVFAGIRWMLRALTTFASAVAATAGLRAVGTGWWFRLGLVTVFTPLKWVPVAAGATMFMMPKETREQLREQVRESFRQFRADINRIWGEEFGEEWRQALERASEEGRIFDPLTVIVENITKTVSAFRQSLAPVTKIIRDWVSGVFGDLSLSEAFQRGVEREGIDPKAAAAWKSFIDLGGAIGELLMESIAAGFDVLELVGLLFLGPLVQPAGMLAEVGAQWAGAITQGFKQKWDEFMAEFEQWWENTWLARLMKQLGALFNLGSDRQAQREVEFLLQSEAERVAQVRALNEQLGTTQLQPTPESLLDRFLRWIRNPLGDAPETTQGVRVQLSEEDRQLIARMVQAEAEGEPFTGQVAVASVILNRLLDPRFPNTVMGVLSQPGQFEPFKEGGRFHQIVEANTEALRAVDEALRGWDPTGGALYFYNPTIVIERAELGSKGAQWILESTIATVDIGRHRFAVPKFSTGVILPGFGGGDRIPALLEPGEAVVPARVVRGGLADIVAWFRRMGVVKMQTGGIVGADLAALEAEYRAVSADMMQFANRLLEGIKEITDTLSAWIFGAAQMIVDVLKVLFPQHAESIQQAFDKFQSWWNQAFRTQQETQAEAVREAVEEAKPAPTPVPEEERSFWQAVLEGLGELVAVTEEAWRGIGPGLEALGILFPGNAAVDAMNNFYTGVQRIGKVVQFFSEGVTAMIDGFNAILGKARDVFGNLGGALAGFFMAGGQGITGLLGAIGGWMGGPIGLGLTLIGGMLSSIWDAPRRALDKFPMPDVGEDILAIGETWRRWAQLEENQRRLEQERQRLVQQHQQILSGTVAGAGLGAIAGGLLFGPIGFLLGGLFGGAIGHQVTKSGLEDDIKRTEEEIRRLTELIQNAKTDIINALGISVNDFASGIASAFKAANVDEFAERLGQSVRDQIRQAMVQLFIAQVLEPQVKALAEMVQRVFLEGAPLDMEALDAQIANIVEISRQLYERFDELGLVTDETSEKLRGMSYNIPRIFRVNLERWRVADVRELPSLADEGYITRSGLAMVHEGEIVAKAERFGGGDIHVTVNVYGDGWDSERLRATIRREVSNAVRDSMSARYGLAGVGV